MSEPLTDARPFTDSLAAAAKFGMEVPGFPTAEERRAEAREYMARLRALPLDQICTAIRDQIPWSDDPDLATMATVLCEKVEALLRDLSN